MFKKDLNAKLTSILKTERATKIAPFAIVAIFALVGMSLITASRAATFGTVLEAENGNLAGNQGAGLAAGASGSSVKFGAAATTPTPPAAAMIPNGVAGNWALTFNDEFDATALDTTKWEALKGTGFNGDETSCLDPSTISQTNGLLDIALNATSCQGKSNMGGGISTKVFRQAYGFYEARINLAGGGGRTYNFPAFWLVPPDPPVCWPMGGEIDIMETIGGGAKSSNATPGSCNSQPPFTTVDGGSGNWSGWHTFAVDWEPGRITAYYDGKSIGSHTSGVSSTPMQIIANNTSRPMGGQTVTGTKIQIDYVRAWKKQ